MLIPVRCFTCGSITGNKWELYKQKQKEGKTNNEIFIEMKVRKYCCKRMFLGHIDLIEKVLQYEEAHPEHGDALVLEK